MASKNKTVRIGSIDFDLQLLDVIQDYKTDENNLTGQISFMRSEIQVSKKMSKQKMFEIFLHECVHGFLETAKIEIKDEEIVVSSVAPVLASFLRDNWKLLQRMGDLK